MPPRHFWLCCRLNIRANPVALETVGNVRAYVAGGNGFSN